LQRSRRKQKALDLHVEVFATPTKKSSRSIDRSKVGLIVAVEEAEGRLNGSACSAKLLLLQPQITMHDGAAVLKISYGY
jgi:hypothetical protein